MTGEAWEAVVGGGLERVGEAAIVEKAGDLYVCSERECTTVSKSALCCRTLKLGKQNVIITQQ